MSKTAKSPITMKISGQFLGVKVNTSNREVYNVIRYMSRKISYRSRDLLGELRPLFNKRIKARIPKLKHQLTYGYRKTIGTHQLENRVHGKHRPHEQIREPLGRIINRGMSFQLVSVGGDFGLRINVYKSRNSQLNFHNKMSRVPKTSTVWSRLDATCLPFVREGHQEEIYRIWLENTAKTLLKDLRAHLEGKRASRDEVD